MVLVTAQLDGGGGGGSSNTSAAAGCVVVRVAVSTMAAEVVGAGAPEYHHTKFGLLADEAALPLAS